MELFVFSFHIFQTKKYYLKTSAVENSLQGDKRRRKPTLSPQSSGIRMRDKSDRGQPTIHHFQTSYYRNWAPTCLYGPLSNTWLAHDPELPHKWQLPYIITYHGTLRLNTYRRRLRRRRRIPYVFFQVCEANKYFRAKKPWNSCYLANSTMGCCSVEYEKSRGWYLTWQPW